MSKEPTYIDVILPLGVPNLYTYSVPVDWNEQLQIGLRVIVQFGKSKLYSAVISKIHTIRPKEYSPKDIHMVLDEKPIIKPYQLAHWNWITNYYMCNPGDVMSAALPGGLKLNSETQVLKNDAVEVESTKLSDDEFLIMEALSNNQVLSLDEIASILNKKSGYTTVKSLLEKEAIVVLEEIKNKYKPKTEKVIALAEGYTSEEALKRLFDLTEKAPKQQAVLLSFMELSKILSSAPKAVRKKTLLEKSRTTSSPLKSLIDKGYFIQTDVIVDRLENFAKEKNKVLELSSAQNTALDEIKSGFSEKDVMLLHGVTSSGKTEIYVKLIQEYLSEGKQVLYLLPEIALTTQIINRLRKYFGERIGIYHSRFSQNERVEIWKKQLSDNGYDIILGARSAVFMPFTNLGLVIVDEEHDTSYKQYEPSPRYNARDTSVVLAHMFNAKVLMGSATPALETMRNAEIGKYGYVSLTERYGGVKLPRIITSDLKQAQKKKQMLGHFSQLLVDEMKNALDNKQQIILFQNRRGFSPYIICNSCGWTPYCQRCDVGLTYHKYLNKLKCHYCGFENFLPSKCGACGSHEVELSGFGTEKIEEDIQIMFPDAKVGRMDLETTRTKNSYQKIITDFEEQRIDVLVGTQMVTKGLDFENVSLVGVLNADQSLNFQDFRAHERSYQLLSQVAGRAGRSKTQGLVIIQSYQPEHPIILRVIESNYLEMYKREIELRNEFSYPPFYKLIRITLKHVDQYKLVDGAKVFADILKKKFGSRILGPEFPAIPRIRNRYLNQMFIKVENTSSISAAKQALSGCIDTFKGVRQYNSIQVIIDVDPY